MSLRTISLRCRQLLVWSAAVWLFVLEAPAQNTGVYVGGHIRRERPATVQKLKHSGFSYVILFNINVETDGTLTTDGETVCRDGEYVFAETQPFYADDVRELKTWPTAIRRIEICYAVLWPVREQGKVPSSTAISRRSKWPYRKSMRSTTTMSMLMMWHRRWRSTR